MKKIIILSVALIILASLCFADEVKQVKPMTLRSGDSFTITLWADSSAGYEWQLAALLDDDILQVVHSQNIPYKRKRSGADLKQLWTFKALKIGQTTISFNYVSSADDAPPQKKETIAVIIK
ncbi:MAG TPA: hypothetical protein ENN23_10415 [Deltaproteobacteria bacterium]|nr:hypothetical protein [Deltaproteobacteria bacterium]